MAMEDFNPRKQWMAEVQLKDLLEAGVHFGHQTKRWNPKMRRYIFAERSGIYLIDLQKTLHQLKAAKELLRTVVMNGDGVLFVCTKKQLKQVIRAEAEKSQSFWVTERWLGGTLTNFETIKKQISRLKEIEQGQEEGSYDFLTKKERLLLERERVKLSRNLVGVKNMARLPGVLFIVDAKKERIAISEANKLGIPVVAIVDTNADPDVITIPIPGNDDAIRSVSLITEALVEVISEARAQVPLRETKVDGETFTYSSGAGTEAGAEERDKGRKVKRKRRPKPEAIAARLRAEVSAGSEEAESSGAPEESGEVTRVPEEQSQT